MAILWQKKHNGDHYEVRTAGNSKRLYKNGVCHSQFNSNDLMTGSIWDLLLLPACYQGSARIKRVLVLGVGGGAVIRQLSVLFQPEQIIGVDIDGQHLEIANRFFDLDAGHIQLIEADAEAWLKHNRGRFDLIIEDVFIEQARRPVRAIAADSDWMRLLLRNLTTNGTLVMNFAAEEEFRQSDVYRDMSVRNAFSAIYQLSMPTLDNLVLALHKGPVLHTSIHRNLCEIPQVNRALQSRKLKYRIRKLRQLKYG